MHLQTEKQGTKFPVVWAIARFNPSLNEMDRDVSNYWYGVDKTNKDRNPKGIETNLHYRGLNSTHVKPAFWAINPTLANKPKRKGKGARGLLSTFRDYRY